MPPLRQPAASRTLVAGLGLLLVLAAVVVFVARPQPSGSRVIEVDEDPAAVAVVVVSLDDIDPNRGTAKVAVSAQAGPAPLPAEGVTVLSGLTGLQPLRLPASELTSSSSTEVLLSAGDVSDYPFDAYELSVPVAVVQGEVTTETDPGSVTYLR